MWKPGAAAPNSGKKSSSNKNKSKNSTTSPLQMANTPSAPKETTPKKLSGATMNMKFMKRKQEIEDHEQKRKRLSTDRNNVEPPVSNPSTNGFVEQLPSTLAARPYDAATQQQQQHQHEDSMDMDEPVSSNKIAYEVATPMDMYEIQASLIGRRSFGGFNAAMEEAWKSSEASRKEQTSQLRKAKVSDEELIQRYQDIVNKRSKSSRVVGNLNEKSVSKRQRRHVK